MVWRTSRRTRAEAWIAGILSLSLASPSIVWAQDSPPVPDFETQQQEGPPRSVPPAGAVLLLPTLVQGDAPSSRAAMDVLIRSALEDLRLPTASPSLRSGACGQGQDENVEAHTAYLDMDLDEALAVAQKAQEVLLGSDALLWACPELDAVEMFMAQIYLDTGRDPEAREMMAQVLARGTGANPDPGKYTPAFRSLWYQTAEELGGARFRDPDVRGMARLGAAMGVEWVVSPCLVSSKTQREALHLWVVSTSKEPVVTSEATVILGASGGWSAAVRQALSPFFLEVVEDSSELFLEQPSEAKKVAVQKPFYRRWWFWTAVGVVVVGGAAVAIGVALGSQEPEPTTVKVDLLYH